MPYKYDVQGRRVWVPDDVVKPWEDRVVSEKPPNDANDRMSLVEAAAMDDPNNEKFYNRLSGQRQRLLRSGASASNMHSSDALMARGLGGLGARGGAGTYVNQALNQAAGAARANSLADKSGMRFTSRERRVGEARGFEYTKSIEGIRRLLANWLDDERTNRDRYNRVLSLIGQGAGNIYGGQ